jgi:hypothetical protein
VRSLQLAFYRFCVAGNLQSAQKASPAQENFTLRDCYEN